MQKLTIIFLGMWVPWAAGALFWRIRWLLFCSPLKTPLLWCGLRRFAKFLLMTWRLLVWLCSNFHFLPCWQKVNSSCEVSRMDAQKRWRQTNNKCLYREKWSSVHQMAFGCHSCLLYWIIIFLIVLKHNYKMPISEIAEPQVHYSSQCSQLAISFIDMQ